jgi:uncharacterized alkaline shock family protein YloU
VTVTIADAAWVRIVVHAAEQVDGVRVRRRGVERDGDRITVQVAARYGTVLPDAARAVQARVAEAVRTMCGVEPSSVDVAVEELL